MRRALHAIAIGLIAVAMLFTAAPVSDAAGYTVTSGDDSGPGTLRDALERGRQNITIDPSVSTISIVSPLVAADQPRLAITGNGQTISTGSAAFDILTTTGVPVVRLTGVNLVSDAGLGVNGGGGFGLHVIVPADTLETRYRVVLDDVEIRGTGLHGVFVDDKLGSPASLIVDVTNLDISNSGVGDYDEDGIRVNESGPGNLAFTSVSSSFTDVGGDGIDLDEEDEGYLSFNSWRDDFVRNGGYCFGQDPLAPLDADCVDVDELDLDDGFDTDEEGPGDLFGLIRKGEFYDSFDEGLDFDEDGDGNIRVRVENTIFDGTTREAMKFSEDNEGDVSITAVDVTILNGVDNDGLQVEEENEGDVWVLANRVTIENNDGDGLRVDEEGDGSLRARIIDSVITGNDDGLRMRERDEGNLKAKVARSTIDGNNDTDVVARQDDAGNGLVRIDADSTIGSTEYEGIIE